MLPLRAHLSIATSALVLVVPVVLGVVVGGFAGGLLTVATGFIAYDLFFIPPYFTLDVGAGTNWVALGVYVVVMVVVARVVARLDRARSLAAERARGVRQLFDLSEALLAEQTTAELAGTIVELVRSSFGLVGVALLLERTDGLEVAARAGTMDESTVEAVRTGTRPVMLTRSGTDQGDRTLALAAAGRPVGLLILHGDVPPGAARELLPTFANHLALALERSMLHERAHAAEILEEVDRLRRALVSAVSHDLRSPLATIKVASTTLGDPSSVLDPSDARELVGLIDLQADRLSRLVTSLLDLSRLEAGVLAASPRPWDTRSLLDEATAEVRLALPDREVRVESATTVPPVAADRLLVGQVLANLIDNADRHGPPRTAITVRAEPGARPGEVVVSVSDEGAGVPASERDTVFESFVRHDTGGRAGLGLFIAKTFVEAHGGRIWVDDRPGGGARFSFTLPAAGEGE